MEARDIAEIERAGRDHELNEVKGSFWHHLLGNMGVENITDQMTASGT